MNPVYYWMFLGVSFFIILTAIFVISCKRPLSSAIFLVLQLVSVGVLYIMLDAPLIAALQWLVYAGAIMVLFVFVILLFQLRDTREEWIQSFDFRITGRNLFRIALSGVILGFLFKFMVVDKQLFQATQLMTLEPLTGGIRAVATLVFTKYLVVFEILSFVLLAALLGAILLARRSKQDA
jgi:NADH-quinone oxidoreductase subunit J